MALPNESVIVTIVYNAPACQITSYLEASLEYIRDKYAQCAIILLRDFNVHHSVWLRTENTDKDESDLYDLSLSYGLEQLVDFDAYHVLNGSFRLDLFLTDHPDSFSVDAYAFTSDHVDVIARGNLCIPPPIKHERTTWLYKRG